MDPATRVLIKVTLEDAAAADDLFSVLMGEDVELRRSFIQRNAKMLDSGYLIMDKTFTDHEGEHGRDRQESVDLQVEMASHT